MARTLSRIEAAVGQYNIEPGVVHGELFELAFTKQIHAAIAQVGHGGFTAIIDEHGSDGRAHTTQVRPLIGTLPQCPRGKARP